MNYRFLLTARWLRYALFAVVVVIACVLLAMWQGDRREERLEEIARVVENYDGPVRTIEEVLPDPSAALAPDDEWTRVELRGSYRPELTQLARNRPRDDQPGFEVVVPFETDDGRLLAVTRGWVETSETGGVPESVPAPPSGTVDLIARVRPAQDGSRDNNPSGVILAVDPARIPGMTDGYTGAYGVMESESPQAAQTPLAMPKPSIDEGSHLSYMMQWLAFAILVIIGVVYAARKEARGDDPEAGPAEPAGVEIVDKDLLVATKGKAYRAGERDGRYGRATKQKRRKVDSEEAYEDAYLDSRGL